MKTNNLEMTKFRKLPVLEIPLQWIGQARYGCPATPLLPQGWLQWLRSLGGRAKPRMTDCCACRPNTGSGARVQPPSSLANWKLTTLRRRILAVLETLEKYGLFKSFSNFYCSLDCLPLFRHRRTKAQRQDRPGSIGLLARSKLPNPPTYDASLEGGVYSQTRYPATPRR